MKVVCIGGKHDGESYDVSYKRAGEYISFPISKPIANVLLYANKQMVNYEELTYEQEYYVLESFPLWKDGVKIEKFWYLRHESLDLLGVLDRLFSHYRTKGLDHARP